MFLPYLNPDPDTNASLYAQDVSRYLRMVLNEQRGDGTYVSTSRNLPSIPANFGSAMVLETENGLKYLYDINNGKLIAIEDSNGAKIEITENADGTQVSISTHGTGTDNDSYGVGPASGQDPTPPPIQEVIIHRELAPEFLGDIKGGIALGTEPQGSAATAYVMYSAESVFTRFSDNAPNANNSDHLIAVKYNSTSSSWEYAGNSTGDTQWHSFDVAHRDRLIAQLDLAQDTITPLQSEGIDPQHPNGIDQGFLSGDMTFKSDWFNGAGGQRKLHSLWHLFHSPRLPTG